MGRTTLIKDADGLRLDIIKPDDRDFPFHFETICVRCQGVVASTTYTAADEHDLAIDQRVEFDSSLDSLLGRVHQAMCGLKEPA